MSTRYPIPTAPYRVEEEINRSRFITTLAPAATVGEAQAFIGSIREEYSDATHNCWAFLVGPPGTSSQVGMSDDGEPHGTAGRPILNVLSHCSVGDIVAVVTRYYGGTKLGKGGLVRAYSSGVQLALDGLTTEEKVARTQLSVLIPYSDVKAFQRLAKLVEAEICEERYEADATFILGVPEEEVSRFKAELNDITDGAGIIEEAP